jgi:hypothetical protein
MRARAFRTTVLSLVAILAFAMTSANSSDGGGVTAKGLFFDTDNNVAWTSTASPAAAPVDSARAMVVSTTEAKPAASVPNTIKARTTDRTNRLGASYFIRLKNKDGTQTDVLATRVFHSGERFQVGVKIARPGYVYILNQGSDGELSQLYPPKDQDGYIDAMGTVFLPGKGSFEFDGVPGIEQVTILLSQRKIASPVAYTQGARPDVVSDPSRTTTSAGVQCTSTPANDAGQSNVPASQVASAGSELQAKGIVLAADDATSCHHAGANDAVLTAKGIYFSDDPVPEPKANLTPASYVVKTQSRPGDVLNIKLKLVHR